MYRRCFAARPTATVLAGGREVAVNPFRALDFQFAHSGPRFLECCVALEGGRKVRGHEVEKQWRASFCYVEIRTGGNTRYQSYAIPRL